ncbi:cytochrome c oxidase subunit 6C-like [Photinus pyralis]|uniref:cytochrome c oxidase subunit 6C-like n=1 Tax=Photinus pyralis TaxID=7054 RepID=UPI001266F8B2|nr:cytochrome c oxidase subunit 6C-like [Photinus pyralis]
MEVNPAKKKLVRPEFTGHLARQIQRNLAMAIAGGVTSSCLFYFFYIRKKKQAYADYHRQLDPDALFEEMRENGVFQSLGGA